jgi:hypothetical protein
MERPKASRRQHRTAITPPVTGPAAGAGQTYRIVIIWDGQFVRPRRQARKPAGG